MKTASFFSYAGPGRISISRFPPRGTAAGYRVFKPLAPGPWFNSVDRKTYETLYAEQLALLDPAQVWTDLHALAGEHEPVLLCYERPPFTATNWCHRRQVAAYFEQHLGHQVQEHDHEIVVPHGWSLREEEAFREKAAASLARERASSVTSPIR